MCPLCREEMGLDEVYGWVREAERKRDEYYLEAEGEVVAQWYQWEVYRRRRVLYELQGLSRSAREKPEMMLVIYSPDTDSYDCRVFYKGRRGSERLVVGGGEEDERGSGMRGDFITGLAHVKVEEFRTLRQELVRRGEPAPLRRVFYSHEL